MQCSFIDFNGKTTIRKIEKNSNYDGGQLHLQPCWNSHYGNCAFAKMHNFDRPNLETIKNPRVESIMKIWTMKIV